MVKIEKGVVSAVLNFIVVGVVVPEVLNFLSGTLSAYISLPPSSSIWTAFILLGLGFAVAAFLQNAYSKGDYPWLAGKLGGNLVDLALFYYLFLLLPGSTSSAGVVVESTGLVALLVLAVALSYGYLIFDFFDARRTRVAQSV